MWLFAAGLMFFGYFQKSYPSTCNPVRTRSLCLPPFVIVRPSLAMQMTEEICFRFLNSLPSFQRYIVETARLYSELTPFLLLLKSNGKDSINIYLDVGTLRGTLY